MPRLLHTQIRPTQIDNLVMKPSCPKTAVNTIVEDKYHITKYNNYIKFSF